MLETRESEYARQSGLKGLLKIRGGGRRGNAYNRE